MNSLPSDTRAEARLASIPWNALSGLGPSLDAPLTEVLHGTPAERVVDAFLRANRAFDNSQRRACAEALFGVSLWRRRLLAQCPLPNPSPRALLATLVLVLGKQEPFTWLDLPPFEPRPVPTDWPSRFSFPDWLVTELERAATPAEPLATALNEPGPICLRFNRLLTTKAQLVSALDAQGIGTRDGALAPDCLIVTTPRPNLLALDVYKKGHFEVQDEGSQFLTELLAPVAGEHVLDLCAGAGGKTLQLASRLGPTGVVHAADIDHARLERLRLRAAKANARVAIHHHLATDLRVDAVFVDAPCSELGALRRGPDKRWTLSPSSFAELPKLQLELLHRGARHVRSGGRLLYATCTFRREENDAVAEQFLAEAPEFQRVPAPHPACDADGALRLLPHRHETDGFYAVLFRSIGS